jgi:hypothetical protein
LTPPAQGTPAKLTLSNVARWWNARWGRVGTVDTWLRRRTIWQVRHAKAKPMTASPNARSSPTARPL